MGRLKHPQPPCSDGPATVSPASTKMVIGMTKYSIIVKTATTTVVANRYHWDDFKDTEYSHPKHDPFWHGEIIAKVETQHCASLSYPF